MSWCWRIWSHGFSNAIPIARASLLVSFDLLPLDPSLIEKFGARASGIFIFCLELLGNFFDRQRLFIVCK